MSAQTDHNAESDIAPEALCRAVLALLEARPELAEKPGLSQGEGKAK